MNPLAVTFNHQFFTDTIKENRKRVCEKIGIDHLMFTPRYDIVKKLLRKSIEKMGDPCWHCHAGIGSYPFQVAVRYDIPLLVWGEPPAFYGLGSYENEEIQGPESFIKRFVKGITADQMVDDEISISDLQPYIFPSLEDLESVGVKGIFLGNYIPWDVGKQVELIKKELGWKGDKVEGSFADYSNVECKYGGVHDYGCYLKRGFGRSCTQASIAIREGGMSRDEALKIIEEYDGERPNSLTPFLKEI